MTHHLFNSLRDLVLEPGTVGKFYSLPALEEVGVGQVSRLPVSIRIVLESILRHCDGNLPAYPCSAIWRPCAAWRSTSARIQRSSSRWCRSIWWWTTRYRSIVSTCRGRSI